MQIEMAVAMVEQWERELTRLERERRADVLSLISARLYFTNPGPPLKSPWRTPYLDSPCLIFSQNSTNSWKVFHSLYNKFYIFDFPELEGAEIDYAKDGWLLMSGDDCTLFFFNPCTRVKIVLPSIPDFFVSVCFTSAPTSGDCCIFGLFDVSTCYEYGFIRFGEDEWELGEWGVRRPFLMRDWPPVFRDGVYYLLESRGTNVMRFDPTEEGERRWEQFGILYEGNRVMNFGENHESEDDDDDAVEEEDNDDEEEEDDDGEEEEEDDDDEEDEDDDGEEEEEEDDDEEEEEEDDDDDDDDEEEYEDEIPETYMVEVEGDIWAVFVRNRTGRVHVEKLDLLNRRWIKLDNLGDKCLYVSEKGSFAEGCLGSDIANKIYFNRFYGKNGVIYCMNSGMYYSVGGDYASKEVIDNTIYGRESLWPDSRNRTMQLGLSPIGTDFQFQRELWRKLDSLPALLSSDRT